MKTAVTMGAAILALGLAAEPAAAQGRPGGCLKYGLGGAIAGHLAGGHRLKGALAGCVLGMARRRQYEREVQERRRNEQIARERSRGPGQTAERRPRIDPIPGPDRIPETRQADRAPWPFPERIPETRQADRVPDTQRADRLPVPAPDRLPDARRADRVPAPLPDARSRPDTGPDWVPDMRRVDRAPQPRNPPAPLPRNPPEPRSPYEDLGLGRGAPPAPVPRQEADRRRAPGDGFETEGTFSRSPIDPAPDRRRQPPAFDPRATGSFIREPGTVY